MKLLKEALELDPEGILAEIRERRALLQDMVGQLYPSILADEIEALSKEENRKRYAPK